MRSTTRSRPAHNAVAEKLDDARWASVSQRDREADGLFVYAVRTTGVFCIPSCPSRRPIRANVAFFTSGDAARTAGFRPCRRCRPDQHRSDPVVDTIVAVCRQIETEPERTDLTELAAVAGWSRGHLQRTFTHRVGVSPRQYAAAHRLLRAKSMLREGANVTDAVYASGFGSSRGFYERASLRLGMPASTYRKGAQDVEVRYASVEVDTDEPDARVLLVAATDVGLCAVRFGSTVDAMVEELEREMPSAKVIDGADDLAEVLSTVVGIYEGKPARVDLPLDVRATGFQAEVWEALRAIPAGETRSYSEIAAAVGRPSAVRAVGSACGANPVALVVPCHRVVRSDGSLGGYRWGLQVKAGLLARERRAAT